MKRLSTGLAIGAVLVAGSVATSWTTFAGALQTDESAAQAPAHRDEFDFSMLIQGLSGTPGCLGVEVAQFQSGKLSIFAWFEDKAAVMRWYKHPIHRGAKSALMPTVPPENYIPLEHITDEMKPIMVIATLTPNRNEAAADMPFQQISIELYRPLPGGLAVGGRLSPDTVSVPHLKAFGDTLGRGE